jgi:two-component sensor histidine kinase
MVNDVSTPDGPPTHGASLPWATDLLASHAVSDALIAIACLAIPAMLLVLVARRRDLALAGVVVPFGLLFLAIGADHVVAVRSLWHPEPWVDTAVKALTAAAALISAAALWRAMPKALALPSASSLAVANEALGAEVVQRAEAEAEARRTNLELEARVAARTADLEAANHRLEALVRDKEVLVREVHHRVKNNLQIITSMMALRARGLSEDMRLVVDEMAGRVRAIARVYEQLDGPGNAGTFDLGLYLDGLPRDVRQTYGERAEALHFRVESESLPVRLEIATPLLLIVNEVLSNVVRHAFPDGRAGTVQVRMAHTEDSVHVTIEDDGIGKASASAEIDEDRALGLRLIEALTRQVGGTSGYEETSAGTRFTLRVPLDRTQAPA